MNDSQMISTQLYIPENDPQVKQVILEERINYKGDIITSFCKGLIIDSYDNFLPLSLLTIYNKVAEYPKISGLDKKLPPYEVVFLCDERGCVYKLIDQRDDTWAVESPCFEISYIVSSHYRIKVGESFLIKPLDGGEKTRIQKVCQILLRNTSGTSKITKKTRKVAMQETIQIGSVFPVRE